MIDQMSPSGPFGRPDPSLPQVFGRYLLVQRLSRGGMGEIFLAKHGLAGFEKLAVIKKVLPHLAADQQFISRFVDEAQVAIKLQHVNVAQVFEVGRVRDEYFLALEYVDGRDLRRTLSLLGYRRQRLPVDLALFVARELANGLAYAHRRTGAGGASLNLVHCDISPPNVLVSFEGETKVIDFGIAKSALRETVTDPKLGFGKFGYMAPEQLIRGGVVDARTDLYAAGVVLFELLTCHRLYEAGPEPDYRALAKKVARGEHPLPSEIDATLAAYDDLVATALRPNPADRYQTAAEFRDAIQHALVAVNPTISTDQLGAFMRELFSEEMTAQRELHDRVASAQLSDFEDQFHSQTISTVSFALAHLPLQPPDPTSPTGRTPVPMPGAMGVAVPARGTRPPHAFPSPALDTRAAPTDAMLQSTDRVWLARSAAGRAVNDSGETHRQLPARRRGWIYALAATTALAVIAVFAVAMTRSEPARSAAPAMSGSASAPARPRDQDVTVVPIEMPPPPPAAQEPAAATDDKIVATAAPPKRVRPADRAAPMRGREPAKDPTKPAVTRDLVAGKYTSLRREYEAFRARNGDRFEKEWSDLATYITFSLTAENLEDATRRIEAFRAKLRE